MFCSSPFRCEVFFPRWSRWSRLPARLVEGNVRGLGLAGSYFFRRFDGVMGAIATQGGQESRVKQTLCVRHALLFGEGMKSKALLRSGVCTL